MINFIKFRLLLAGAILAALSCFANGAENSQGESQYKLRPLDVLTIKVFQEPDLDTVYKISQNGMIVLPLVNAVKSRGLPFRRLKNS